MCGRYRSAPDGKKRRKKLNLVYPVGGSVGPPTPGEASRGTPPTPGTIEFGCKKNIESFCPLEERRATWRLKEEVEGRWIHQGRKSDLKAWPQVAEA
ncbi:hypothetical protein E2C01_041437 [Portunus trituberculatus]|uniref:Uncharacterized protein n=1 Tax=Portunus trituberculatus TaxID=210409 RepID=A0A5B7FRQ2_PORTR|nr:hypothetical protein [Portunus trituberculatus]